jgi:hypothetical protein
VTGKEISSEEYRRLTAEPKGPKADLGEDEKIRPELPMPAKAPPPPLPDVRVVPLRQIWTAIEHVLTIYRGEPNVERFARHLSDKLEAMATPIKPVVSAEVRDPKELMR